MCVPESRSHSHTRDWCRNDAVDFRIRVIPVPPLSAPRLAVDVDDDSELHILVPVEAAVRISVCHESSNLNSCDVFVWLPCFAYITGFQRRLETACALAKNQMVLGHVLF